MGLKFSLFVHSDENFRLHVIGRLRHHAEQCVGACSSESFGLVVGKGGVPLNIFALPYTGKNFLSGTVELYLYKC
jgi:hypothetical protein